MRFNKNELPKNWETYSLNRICKNITSGGTPSRSNPSFYENGEVCWVKTKELNNTYLFDTEEKITKEALNNSSAKLLPANTILLAMYGATVGELGILAKEMSCNQACCALIIDPEVANFKYVYYLLRLYKEDIKSLATGAAQQNLSAKTIREFEFDFPDLKKQDEIVKILSDLDEKIQLNTQINQTLEQIAQTIFKSWFIDFDPVHAKANALANGATTEQATLAAMQTISGKTAPQLTAYQTQHPESHAQLYKLAQSFPSEFEEIDGVEVPKGWEVRTIGECYQVEMGQSPKGETYNEIGNGALFFQGRAEFGWRFPSPRLYTTEPKKFAQQGDVLMSVRAPVGDMNVALARCCIGRGLCALRNKNELLSFGIYQLKSLQSKFDVFNGEGTVFGSINQKDLKEIKIIKPDLILMKKFDKAVSFYDKKIESLSKENNFLEEARDLLLPKLLSGEVL